MPARRKSPRRSTSRSKSPRRSRMSPSRIRPKKRSGGRQRRRQYRAIVDQQFCGLRSAFLRAQGKYDIEDVVRDLKRARREIQHISVDLGDTEEWGRDWATLSRTEFNERYKERLTTPVTFSIPVRSISRIVDDIGANWDEWKGLLAENPSEIETVSFDAVKERIKEMIIEERLGLLPKINLGVNKPDWDGWNTVSVYLVFIITLIATQTWWMVLLGAVIAERGITLAKRYRHRQRITDAHQRIENTRT